MDLTERESVELFHLLFLRQLVSGPDRSHYAVKGGVNLRFFFESVRYSEDLDLDVAVVAPGTLRQKVDRLLVSPALALPLRSRGIELVGISAPKQTDTTQRWKLGLQRTGTSLPVRTKVEFSRRQGKAPTGAIRAEPVLRQLAAHYGLPAPVVPHYEVGAAVLQKIRALIGRPETQARDVFDLHLLRPRLGQHPKLDPALRTELPRAIDRVLGLTFADYLGHVVAYLVPGEGASFSDEPAWEAMQLDVLQLLEELGR